MLTPLFLSSSNKPPGFFFECRIDNKPSDEGAFCLLVLAGTETGTSELLTNRLSLMELAEHSSFAVWDQLLKKKKKTFA